MSIGAVNLESSILEVGSYCRADTSQPHTKFTYSGLNPWMWLKLDDLLGLPKNAALGKNPDWHGANQWGPPPDGETFPPVGTWPGGGTGTSIWPSPPHSYTDDLGGVSTMALDGSLNYGLLGATTDQSTAINFGGLGCITLAFVNYLEGGYAGFADEPMSVGFWFKRQSGPDAATGSIFSLGAELGGVAGIRTLGDEHTLEMHVESLSFTPVEHTADWDVPILFDGSWHFVVLNFTEADGTTLSCDLYLDAAFVATKTITDPPLCTGAPTTGWCVGGFARGPTALLNNAGLQHFGVWPVIAGSTGAEPSIPLNVSIIETLFRNR